MHATTRYAIELRCHWIHLLPEGANPEQGNFLHHGWDSCQVRLLDHRLLLARKHIDLVTSCCSSTRAARRLLHPHPQKAAFEGEDADWCFELRDQRKAWLCGQLTMVW